MDNSSNRQHMSQQNDEAKKDLENLRDGIAKVKLNEKSLFNNDEAEKDLENLRDGIAKVKFNEKSLLKNDEAITDLENLRAKLAEVKLNEKALEKRLKLVSAEKDRLNMELNETKKISRELLADTKILRSSSEYLSSEYEQDILRNEIDQLNIKDEKISEKYIQEFCNIILTETMEMGQFATFVNEHLLPHSEELPKFLSKLSERSELACQMRNKDSSFNKTQYPHSIGKLSEKSELACQVPEKDTSFNEARKKGSRFYIENCISLNLNYEVLHSEIIKKVAKDPFQEANENEPKQ